MLADLSLEAISDPCARGGLLDRTNTHVLSSPDVIARSIAITPASDHAIATTPSVEAPELGPLPIPSVHKCYTQIYNHNE
eukprot:10650552-Ditylum_brightwellii.AAC.1